MKIIAIGKAIEVGRNMSQKVILSTTEIDSILEYINKTYQCTIRDVCDNFCISRHVLYNNIGKELLNSVIFHGVKDSTRERIRNANLGKKQSLSTKLKRVKSNKIANEKRTEEDKQKTNAKREQTIIQRYGSLENKYKLSYEKTKQTKTERYGDPNYNNHLKCAKTKLERYGNPNYNNQSKIAQTQTAKYGRYAFNDFDKVHRTNLSKYGVEHNWASPEHDGHDKRYAAYGGKDNYYKHVYEKGKKTRLELYGDEFYSNSAQAQKTCLQRYGVPFYMLTEDFRSKSVSPETQQKKISTKAKNNTFHKSSVEDKVGSILIDYFGAEDVLEQYQDDRYINPLTNYFFVCDFYIKSKDLFIELNYHPAHGLHPYDDSNVEDAKIVEKLKSNPTPWNTVCLDVWTIRDPLKQKIAKENSLKYLMLYPTDDYNDIIFIIKENFNNDEF